MLTKDIKNRFAILAGQLSPENISCDGMLSRAKIAARRKQIMKEWASLEKQAGVKVTEDQVWQWSY
jgi:hypothetical protein